MPQLPQTPLGGVRGTGLAVVTALALLLIPADAGATPAPRLAIVTPGASAHVSGKLVLRTKLSRAVGRYSLVYSVDGDRRATVRTRARTHTWTYDTSSLVSGAHTFIVEAHYRDSRGRQLVWSSRRVVVTSPANGGAVRAQSEASTTPDAPAVTPPQDRTPPSAPTLSVGTVTGASAQLDWDASTDNVGVTGYLVLLAGGVVGLTADTSFTLMGLDCETDYSVAVAARDKAGNSSTGASVSFTTGSCVTPSGAPMPLGDLADWKQVVAENFRVDAATGSMGSDNDANQVIYTGARGSKWVTYPKSFTDTYNHRPYRSDAVLSAHDGVLDFHLQNVDGQPAGANPSPLMPDGTQYQTYGRYSARMKVDDTDLSEYYVAWLLWPKDSDAWKLGESDFPEQSLQAGANPVNGVFHYGAEDNGDKKQVVFADPTVSLHDWHTYTQEWTPGSRKYYIDGRLVFESSGQDVYDKAERWQLQTETNGDGTHDGHLLIDWAVVYAYAPAG